MRNRPATSSPGSMRETYHGRCWRRPRPCHQDFSLSFGQVLRRGASATFERETRVGILLASFGGVAVRMLGSFAVRDGGAEAHALPARALALRMRWAACDVADSVVIALKSKADERDTRSDHGFDARDEHGFD